jgi:gelsolin
VKAQSRLPKKVNILNSNRISYVFNFNLFSKISKSDLLIGGSDEESEKAATGIRKLFRLSDASGQMTFAEVATGNNIKKNQFDTNDVFIFDAGSEVYAWIGLKASKDEKRKALGFAQDYLSKYNRPVWLPIVRIMEGGENEVFEQQFH